MNAEVVPTARGPVEVAGAGAGPAVMLIHGMPGSWRQAIPLAEDLAPHHTVLLPSRPGYGRTPLRSGRTPDEQADLYAATLDALGISRAAVVGISGGGPSALAFAQRHPEGAQSLALLCALAAHLITVPRSMRVAAALPPLARAARALHLRRERRVLADPALLDSRLATDLTAEEAALAAEDAAVRADLVRFLQGHVDAPSGVAGLLNDTRQLRSAARTGPQPTDRIACPTLVLHGDADAVVPVAHAEHHAAAIAGASLHVFPRSSHVFVLTHRREVSALLRPLVASGP
jgi:pimeloyl-ACP methyl ester carboxylesterase